MPPLPEVVYALAARVNAKERDGADSWPPARARARTTDGKCLNISASRLSGAGGIAVVFEPARPPDIAPLFLRSCATTRRKRELIGLILVSRSFRPTHSAKVRFLALAARSVGRSLRSA
jgi:hypothetical protein